jgi:CHAT domain-containing protein
MKTIRWSVLISLLSAISSGQPAASLPELDAKGRDAIKANDLKGAEAIYRSALEKARAENDWAWEAEFTREIGETYERRNQFREALPFYESSLAIRRAHDDAPQTARLLAGIGSAHLRLRDDALAEQFLEQALVAFSALDDSQNAGLVTQMLGQLKLQQGKTDEAQSRLLEAAALYDKIHDNARAALVRDDLADLHRRRSEYSAALQSAFEALEISRTVNAPPVLARTLEVLGNTFADTEQPEKALTYYQQCLEIRLKMNPLAAAVAYNNIGLTLEKLGHNAEAAETLAKAMELRRNGGNPGEQAETLINLANAQQELGKTADAAASFQAALKIAEERHFNNFTALALYGLGNIALREGNIDQAIAQHTRALELRRQIGDRILAVHSMNRLALAYEAKGDLARSENLHAVALDEFEKIAAGITDPAQIGRFRRSTVILYPHYARVLLREGKTEAAFAIAERSRGAGLARMSEMSRGHFLESLAAADRTAWDESTSARAMATNRLRDALAAKAAPGAIDKARADYLRADSALEQLRDRIYAANPSLAARREPVNTQKILAASRAQPSTLFLEWMMVDESSALLFAVSGGGIRGFELAAGREQFAAAASRWQASFSQGVVRGVIVAKRAPDPQAEEASARQLYSAVFGPMEAELAKKSWKRVVLVPDGPLLDLPFAALADASGTRLIDSYPLSSAISVESVFTASPHSPAQRTLLAVGDPFISKDPRLVAPGGDLYPPLEHSRAEAERIAALFPKSELLIGDNARESDIKRDLARYRILHFATHGVLSQTDGMQSGLLLANEMASSKEDGLLQAWEIADRSLAADLAVLSACQTAQGDERLGEGLMGLAWAFQAAGCSNVVASLWNIDDEVTSTLMLEFYKSVRKGRRLDEALREAMLAVKKTPGNSSPYYWAGFRVIGPAEALK